MLHPRVFASMTAVAVAAAFIACVGDDPDATPPSPAGNDGGSTPQDGSTTPTADGSPADGGTCDLAADFTEIEPIPSLSGAAEEMAITLSQDEREAIFASARDEAIPDGSAPANNANLWMATRPDLASPFGQASSLATALDGVGTMDIDPTLSPNGLLLIWTQRIPNGSEHRFQYAERSAASTPAFVPRGSLTFGDGGADNPGGAYPKGTTLLPNGALYFVMLSNGDPEYKLYRSAPVALGKYAMPVEQTLTAGQHIFTDAVAVAADERTLYIGGAGANEDISVLTRPKVEDPWGPPRVLEKISSTSGDQPRWLSPDGCRLYITSWRSGAGDLLVARRK